jgi:putative restriction endonuclease
MSPRIFGDVPGVREGDEFLSRDHLHDAAVRAPTQAGISGSAKEGADSIVLSGGYEDDFDEGDVIVYTGEGGRDAATGQQVRDQRLTRRNLALARSQALGLPVRVTRGAKHASPLSPKAGYRYGGLYRVEDHWYETGRSGFGIYRFRLVKLTPALTTVDVGPPSEPAGPAPRKQVTVQRLVRDTAVARRVKELHDFTCQMCGERLLTPSGAYAEAAHIRPLGAPHHGPDVASNVLCLCPNHHVLFDLGGVAIADDFSLIGLPGVLRRVPKHPLALEHVQYHRQRYAP